MGALDFEQVNIWHLAMCVEWVNGKDNSVMCRIDSGNYHGYYTLMFLKTEDEMWKAIEMHNEWLKAVESVAK